MKTDFDAQMKNARQEQEVRNLDLKSRMKKTGLFYRHSIKGKKFMVYQKNLGSRELNKREIRIKRQTEYDVCDTSHGDMKLTIHLPSKVSTAFKSWQRILL